MIFRFKACVLKIFLIGSVKKGVLSFKLKFFNTPPDMYSIATFIGYAMTANAEVAIPTSETIKLPKDTTIRATVTLTPLAAGTNASTLNVFTFNVPNYDKPAEGSAATPVAAKTIACKVETTYEVPNKIVVSLSKGNDKTSKEMEDHETTTGFKFNKIVAGEFTVTTENLLALRTLEADSAKFTKIYDKVDDTKTTATEVADFTLTKDTLLAMFVKPAAGESKTLLKFTVDANGAFTMDKSSLSDRQFADFGIAADGSKAPVFSFKQGVETPFSVKTELPDTEKAAAKAVEEALLKNTKGTFLFATIETLATALNSEFATENTFVFEMTNVAEISVNAVDEVKAISKVVPVAPVTTTTAPAKSTDSTKKPDDKKSEDEEKEGMSGTTIAIIVVVVILVLAIIIGGAFYYFKFVANKNSGNTDELPEEERI